MENLWAPWRIEYILGKREPYCVFCPDVEGYSDEERLVLCRNGLTMVLMNKYPYNNGHLLVCPKRHIAGLEDLTAEEMLEIMQWITKSIAILKRVMNPDGFNVGLNLGTVAGAGMESHLHFHIVPRWNGDSNFIAVLAEVRSIPEHFRETYAKLAPHFKKESSHEVL